MDLYSRGQLYSQPFAVHPLKGAVFETYIYGELLKLYFNSAQRTEPIVIYNGDEEQRRTAAHVMPVNRALRYFSDRFAFRSA